MQACFDPLEAHQILRIPISFRSLNDELIWHIEINGVYSVRSAYHTLHRNMFSKKPDLSSISYQQVWKKVWHAHLHPRVKNFLWRLTKNIFPTKTNLQRKDIRLDSLCSFYGSYVENAKHTFLHCEFSRLACFSSPLGFRMHPNVEILDWLLYCLTSLNTLISQIMCIMLWKVWEARNIWLY